MPESSPVSPTPLRVVLEVDNSLENIQFSDAWGSILMAPEEVASPAPCCGMVPLAARGQDTCVTGALEARAEAFCAGCGAYLGILVIGPARPLHWPEEVAFAPAPFRAY